jgi:hypothetical protein
VRGCWTTGSFMVKRSGESFSAQTRAARSRLAIADIRPPRQDQRGGCDHNHRSGNHARDKVSPRAQQHPTPLSFSAMPPALCGFRCVCMGSTPLLEFLQKRLRLLAANATDGQRISASSPFWCVCPNPALMGTATRKHRMCLGQIAVVTPPRLGG